MREELLDPSARAEEADDVDEVLDDDHGLRPRTLAEFVGQAELKEHLTIMLEAARRRRQAADHLLFAGPPGLGKTSLAGIVAHELEVTMVVTSGPALDRAGDLAAILTKLEEGDVLFIDEIHRLPRAVEEVLYPAMEDFEIDIVLGKGPAARSVRLDLPPFTLIGATTRTGLITGPLRDRFGLVARLDYYEPDDLRAIVLRAADILEVTVDEAGAGEIATRARGTPRIANRLLRRVRDYAEVEGRRHRRSRRGPSRLWPCSVSTTPGSTRWTGPCSAPSARSSVAARSASRTSPSPSVRPPRPSRTCTSRSSSNRACSCAPRRAVSPPTRPGAISASHRHRPRCRPGTPTSSVEPRIRPDGAAPSYAERLCASTSTPPAGPASASRWSSSSSIARPASSPARPRRSSG